MFCFTRRLELQRKIHEEILTSTSNETQIVPKNLPIVGKVCVIKPPIFNQTSTPSQLSNNEAKLNQQVREFNQTLIQSLDN